MSAVSRRTRHGFVLAAAAAMGWLFLTGPAAMAGDHEGRGEHEGHDDHEGHDGHEGHGRRCEHCQARPDRTVLRAFDDLLKQIQEVPHRTLPHGQKTSLYLKVASARHSYKDGCECPAAQILASFLRRTQSLREHRRSVAVAEDLYAGGRALRDLVVANASAKSSCADPSIGRQPTLEVLASDNEHFSARVRFGAPGLTAVKAGDETWTQLRLPGIDNVVGPAGQPSLPSWQALIGIPQGAGLLLPAVQTVVRERIALNLYPFQRQAADQVRDPRFGDEPLPPPVTFMDPPFFKDEKAYEIERLRPAQPLRGQAPGPGARPADRPGPVQRRALQPGE